MTYVLAIAGVIVTLLAEYLNDGWPICVLGFCLMIFNLAYWGLVYFGSTMLPEVGARIEGSPRITKIKDSYILESGDWRDFVVTVLPNPSKMKPRLVLLEYFYRPLARNKMVLHEIFCARENDDKLPAYRLFGKWGPVYVLPLADVASMIAGVIVSFIFVVLGWVF
jgi:hypothetical protein